MISIFFNRYYDRTEWRGSAGALTAGVVDGIFPGQNELGDGHKGIALLGQLLQNGGQRLGGVEGRIVKEHDGPRAHLAGYPLGDLFGGDLLPVQAIPIPNSFKLLCHKKFKILWFDGNKKEETVRLLTSNLPDYFCAVVAELNLLYKLGSN